MRGGLIVTKYVTLALLVVSRAVVRENFVLFIHRQVEQSPNTTIFVRNRAPLGMAHHRRGSGYTKTLKQGRGLICGVLSRAAAENLAILSFSACVVVM